MVFWLLQQAHTYISTKLRYLFMNQNVGFLYNVDETHGTHVLEYTAITEDWVDDEVTGPIINPKNGAFVETVEFCKCKTLPAEHEFLLCYLKEADPKDPSCPRQSVVLIERNNIGPKDNTGAKTPTDAHGNAVNGRIDVGEDLGNGSRPESMALELPPSDPQTARSPSETDIDGSYSNGRLDFLQSISSSSPSFRKRKSGDYMVFSRNGKKTFVFTREGRHKAGRTLTLPPKTLTLFQLTTLFCVVHHKEPDYRLSDYNCYWLSGAIYKSILELVEGCTEEINPRVKIGSAVKLLPGLPGRFTLEEFVADYKTQWERTQENIRAVRERTDKPIRDAQEAQMVAENARLESENARLESENARLESETARLEAEEKIKRLEENARLEAEKVKQLEENARLEAEEKIKRLENARLEAEKTKRLEAELERFRKQSQGNQSTAAPATRQRPS